jgi:hypothetical protein
MHRGGVILWIVTFLDPRTPVVPYVHQTLLWVTANVSTGPGYHEALGVPTI